MAPSDEPSKAAGKVQLLVVAYVLVTILFVITNKVNANVFTERYVFFSMQLCTVLFMVIVLAVCIWKAKYTKDISSEMRAYPLSHFFYMCCFDSVASLLVTIATPGTPGSLTALLPQMIVPLNIALSYYFLSARYSKRQLCGAALVLSGCAIAVSPLFLSGSSKKANLLSIFIFVLSRVPTACSSVYKEKCMGDIEMDSW
jgi:drug/metabolite transporter (DMT)-like permease